MEKQRRKSRWLSVPRQKSEGKEYSAREVQAASAGQLISEPAREGTGSSSLIRCLALQKWGDVSTMPGIDYRQLRASISIAEILQLIGFVPAQARGPQLRGPCPEHGSRSLRSRVFSVNLQTNAYQCFKCRSAGNQLDLYAAVTKKSLYQAARDLCEKINYPTPWMERW